MEVRALFDSLQVNFTPGVRQTIAELSGADTPTEAKPGATHSLKRDSRANIKNWQSRLSEDHIRTIREITEEVAAPLYDQHSW